MCQGESKSFFVQLKRRLVISGPCLPTQPQKDRERHMDVGEQSFPRDATPMVSGRAYFRFADTSSRIVRVQGIFTTVPTPA
jgi:hypothetical protein